MDGGHLLKERTIMLEWSPGLNYAAPGGTTPFALVTPTSRRTEMGQRVKVVPTLLSLMWCPSLFRL